MPGRAHLRVDAARVGDHGHEARRLGHRQLASGLVVVRAGGRLASVDPVAPLDHVEVEGEDPPLREVLLQPVSDDHLAQLAGEALAGVEEQVLGELLGDRAPSADRLALRDVRLHRLLDRLPVDSVVAEELLVLGGDRRLDEVPGDAREGDPRLHRAGRAPFGPRLVLALPHDARLSRALPGKGADLASGRKARQDIDQEAKRAARHEEGGGEKAAPHERSAG